MSSPLQIKLKQWEALKNKGAAQQEIDKFYKDEVLPAIIQSAREKWLNEPDGREQYDVLISMSGFSPETTILAFSILQPKHLMVISSDAAAEGINTIAKTVVGSKEGQIPHRAFAHYPCDPTDPADIFRNVRDHLERLRRSPGMNEHHKAIIDLTGGKKVMSAAAAMAAWQLDLPLCYVESDFDPKTRRPHPGSERLMVLAHPTRLLGDEKVSQAISIFNSGHFSRAYEEFEYLRERIAEPLFAAFMAKLSAFYRCLCDLSLTDIASAATEVEQHLRLLHKDRLSREQTHHLEKQLEFARDMANEQQSALIICFFMLGCHYMEKLGRHDFAALLFYRTLEGCLQQRLESLKPGFSCQNPDYTLLDPNTARLLASYNNLAQTLGPGERERTLPLRLGYINTAAMLFLIQDRMLPEAGFSAESLGKLKSLGDLRNRSILAHGYRVVTAEDSREMQRVSECVLRSFLRLTPLPCIRPNQDLKELRKTLRFLEIT